MSGGMSLPPPPAYFQQQQQAQVGGPGAPGSGSVPGGAPGAGFGSGPGMPPFPAYGAPSMPARPFSIQPYGVGLHPPPATGGSGGPAPTYVPPIPIPPESELLSRPPPTGNIDPLDETYPTFNVFVGDMTPDFSEADLYAAYQPAGPIHSVNVVRDKISGMAKGFGFVNFASAAAKARALNDMKQTTVRGIPIRCFESDAKNTLLVAGLPPAWTPAQLKQELERIGGPMLGEPVPVPGRPGQAHVSYINFRRAEKALALISGKPCGTSPAPGAPMMNASLAVGKPPPKIPGGPSAGGKPPATLFIKNISAAIDEAALAGYFAKYATVVKCTIVRDPLTGESKGFGFVELPDMDEAAKALNGVHLTILEGKVLSVEYAKVPDGSLPPVGGGARVLGPGGVPLPQPPRPAPSKPAPRSRHQNDGDGGFNAPRGFADAAIEARQGIPGQYTIHDDGWHAGNVPAGAAMCSRHEAPKPGPLMREGKMVGWGYPHPEDEMKIGSVAPPQGTPESKCKAQRPPPGSIDPKIASYDYTRYYNYAGPPVQPPGGFVPPPPHMMMMMPPPGAFTPGAGGPAGVPPGASPPGAAPFRPF